ncbi:L-threonylcarbamoyladenylate synthase [Herbinix hemicellulosilytica]|uniref:Threonylcarbamoyl-AMP synthase n=1 Tax=Herbinix hemicellulosilytica TaxID=1564487 RepID=A0A0H5SIQ6_HERHM|nr:L-threonylcarbamoyladenylate synthase [Herbinix hemicellulosilytica]RBP59183.1 L-threonylcarbamoyladenylate synthase [Herbinix hemicellulosilytica]CRZ35374.1 putative tRNA threonylcarbamoyladenosine biosynthesis protein YwlC [Herbinix hemicellulosilytica]
MNTLIIQATDGSLKEDDLKKAADIIKSGGLVAFPTETVYGLGADALNPEASKKIYEAKGRPSDNPLIVHIAYPNDIEAIAKDIPKEAYRLAEVFWPGPLTIILGKKEIVPYNTTGGLDTVAIRLPANKTARALIERSGGFIAAPSANSSGKPSPTQAKHVIDDLYGKVDMIIDGGKSTLGLESTIVDLTGEKPVILRPGCITKAMLENVIGKIEYDKAILNMNMDENIIPKAPGMKYRHYAPEGCLTIYEGNIGKVAEAINKRAKECLEKGKTVGIIATEETKDLYQYGTVEVIGSRKEEDSIAAGLYAVLRKFDELHTEYIFSESFADNGLGQAIMNRLLKAAGYRLVKVE